MEESRGSPTYWRIGNSQPWKLAHCIHPTRTYSIRGRTRRCIHQLFRGPPVNIATCFCSACTVAWSVDLQMYERTLFDSPRGSTPRRMSPTATNRLTMCTGHGLWRITSMDTSLLHADLTSIHNDVNGDGTDVAPAGSDLLSTCSPRQRSLVSAPPAPKSMVNGIKPGRL